METTHPLVQEEWKQDPKIRVYLHLACPTGFPVSGVPNILEKWCASKRLCLVTMKALLPPENQDETSLLPRVNPWRSYPPVRKMRASERQTYVHHQLYIEMQQQRIPLPKRENGSVPVVLVGADPLGQVCIDALHTCWLDLSKDEGKTWLYFHPERAPEMWGPTEKPRNEDLRLKSIDRAIDLFCAYFGAWYDFRRSLPEWQSIQEHYCQKKGCRVVSRLEELPCPKSKTQSSSDKQVVHPIQTVAAVEGV